MLAEWLRLAVEEMRPARARFAELMKSGITVPEDVDEFSTLRNSSLGGFTRVAPFFKDPTFFEKEEWRLVFRHATRLPAPR
jgi:hypothetical protein